ncbi:MAG: hypothetical protein R3C61_17585 [Bacteroidia bacterium]
MAKLDSILRKKVLEARPPIKTANWGEMEKMIAAAQGRKRRGIWLFFSDAGFLLLVGLLAFHRGSVPAVPEYAQDCYDLPVEQEIATEKTPEKTIAKPEPPAATVEFISTSTEEIAGIDGLQPRAQAQLYADERDNHESTNKDRIIGGFSSNHFPVIIPLHALQFNPGFTIRPSNLNPKPVYTPPPRWQLSRWALEVHLNNVHAPVYWGNDPVKRFFSNYNSPGIGMSFIRRKSHRYAWGIRFDLDVPSYPVDTSPDDPYAYSRMWGGGWDIGFFMRQYMNDDPARRFRPYWQAGLGYNIIGMNAYNITRIDNPYDDPKTQWVLRKSRLEAEAIDFYPFETYIHMTTSGGIGAELRIFRRVSFTMSSVVYANMLINKDRLNNPDQYWGYDYYIKHSLGLQYGF